MLLATEHRIATTFKAFLLFILLGASACGGPPPSSQTLSGAPPANQIKQKIYDDGEYIIHFNGLNSDFISPEIARTYNINRSKNRGLVNVAVHKKNADGSKSSIKAELNPTVANLTGQLKKVDWRLIEEQDAVYYIGLVGVANGETLIFDLNLIPEGKTNNIPVRFQHRFFSD